eukprot:2669426-Prorocentrum_lima.AAC.1
MIITQYAEPSKATRTKECAGYSGPKMTAPSIKETNKPTIEKVAKGRDHVEELASLPRFLSP